MSVIIDAGSTDTKNATVLYQNVFEEGIVTVSSQAADGAGLNAIEDTTFDFWTPLTVIARLDVDCGEPVACDCLGIAAHNIGFSGTTIKVLYSDDGTTYNDASSTIDPVTDETIMLIFPQTIARYWRISVRNAVCSIGVIKLGKRLVFPSGVISGYNPINHANTVELMTNTSVKGQYLGTRIQRVGAETSINFGMLDTDFVDNDMLMFESHFNSGRTFFYAGSPSEWPEDYGYCWRSGGEMRPTMEEGGVLHSVSMDIAVYVDG